VPKIKDKLNEALLSVLPLSSIILIILIFFVPVSSGLLISFAIGIAALIIGMFLFTYGADISTMPMGEAIGSYLSRAKKLWLILGSGAIIGILITVAEPDLIVLSKLVPNIPDKTLIYTISAGVGAFLVISFLRTLFKLSLRWLLLGFYAILFCIAAFVPPNFLATAFDSGGVTTGPVSVPFILAIGAGIASVRGTKDKGEESFGLVALCSIGPILSVLILSLLFKGKGSYSTVAIHNISSFSQAIGLYLHAFADYAKEVALALSPILILFIIFQIFALKLSMQKLLSISLGLLFTFLGLVLFLIGANIGFVPIGQIIGASLVASRLGWIIIPLGFIMGLVIVLAEPAIHVLKQEVQEVTNGAISARVLLISLCIGVAISVCLAMVRVYTGLSLWWIILPGYCIALITSFFVPPIYTAIAFDSGGVASGPMTSTFLLAFALGATNALGGNVLTDAFGLVALVALAPLVAIQILGLFAKKDAARTFDYKDDNEIIDYNWRVDT
jgi:hypothetical protein